MENPPKKYFVWRPPDGAAEKRFIIKCDEVIKDATGTVTELHWTYFPESRSGHDTSGLSCESVIHWVSANMQCRKKFGCMNVCF